MHIARNALGEVRRKHQQAIVAGIRAIFNAPTLAWAHELKLEVVERWTRTHPHVSEWLKTALEDGLACFAFREPHRRRIQSMNGLERFNQELPRRTRAVRILPSPEACLRLVIGLCGEQSEEGLAGRVDIDMRKLDLADADQEPQAPVADEEVESTATLRSLSSGGTKAHRAKN